MKSEDHALLLKVIKDRYHKNQADNIKCICGNYGRSSSPYVCKAFEEMFEAYKEQRELKNKSLFDK